MATPARVIAHATRRGRLVDFSQPEALGDLHLCEFDYLSLEKTLNFVGLRVVELIPTSITLPLIHRLPLANPLGHRLAAWFPRLGDTLLVRCRLAPALDLDRQLGYWLGTELGYPRVDSFTIGRARGEVPPRSPALPQEG